MFQSQAVCRERCARRFSGCLCSRRVFGNSWTVAVTGVLSLLTTQSPTLAGETRSATGTRVATVQFGGSRAHDARIFLVEETKPVSDQAEPKRPASIFGYGDD